MVPEEFGRRGSTLKELAGGEVANEFAIRGEKVELGQGVEWRPAEIVIDAVGEFALKAAHGEELKVDGATVAVIVANVCDQCADSGVNADFLIEFAPQCIFWGFTRFDFAAGKFPFKAHGLVWPALADKNVVTAQDQRGHHVTDGLVGVAACVVCGHGGFL